MSLVLQSAFSKMCRVSTRFLPSLTSAFSAQVDSSVTNKPPPPKHGGDVPKVRRPLSPFAVFMQSQYGKLKSEHPTSKATDVMKLASNLYAKLPQDEKKRLVDVAFNDRQRYEADMKHLTEDQRTELVALSQKKRHSREIKQRRRHWRETGRPIRPMNAPLLYMKEHWATRGTRKVPDFVSDIMAEWRALPEEQKQKYRLIQEENKKKYAAEFTAWKAKLALEAKSDKGTSPKTTKKSPATAETSTPKRGAPSAKKPATAPSAKKPATPKSPGKPKSTSKQTTSEKKAKPTEKPAVEKTPTPPKKE